MSDFAKVEGHKGLVRELNSKAILNTDHEALMQHRRNKKVLKDLLSNSEKIEKLENDINEIKDMLVELIKTKNTRV